MPKLILGKYKIQFQERKKWKVDVEKSSGEIRWKAVVGNSKSSNEKCSFVMRKNILEKKVYVLPLTRKL